MKVERVALVVHDGKSTAVALEKELTNWLGTRGVAVSDDRPDLVISLGGDGTVLRAAGHAHAVDAPLLAVNMGTLGYLTEVEAGASNEALERIFASDFHIEERMMLACDAESPDGLVSFVGLNEVLVERSSRSRLVKLEVSIGGERLATYNADGVIVATPTGSTAYALSAGGPIVSPRAQCLVVTPVSAHMIFSRPVVLAPDETVEITVAPADDDRDQDALIVLDGLLRCRVDHGGTVVARRHERPLRLVRLSGPGFLERLRIKLHLPS
ncbi:MAG: NAD(+)/NADH kinase [Actinomycetota bacterium]|nr:NAD(+)/NADH kinase [Actinomycetota bacterium]